MEGGAGSGGPEGGPQPTRRPPATKSRNDAVRKGMAEFAKSGGGDQQRRFVERPGPLLRRTVSEQPPSERGEQADHHDRRDDRAAAQSRPQRLGRAYLDALKIKKPPDSPGACTGPEARDGVALQSNFCREARNAKRLVETARGPRPIRRERTGTKEPTPGPQARKIDDEMVSRPPNINVLPVDGELEVGKDFEGQGHVYGLHPWKREVTGSFVAPGESQRRLQTKSVRQWDHVL